MRKSFKRLLLIICATVMMLTPLSALASSDIRIIPLPVNNRYGYENHPFEVIYSPASVSATRKGKSIVVKAEVTKIPDLIQIQYSNDAAFKKGVVTKSFSNKGRDKELGTYYYRIIKHKNGKKYSYYPSAGNIHVGSSMYSCKYRTSYSAAYKLIHSANFIKAARSKVRNYGTYTLAGVGKNNGRYVRIRTRSLVGTWSNWKTVNNP